MKIRSVLCAATLLTLLGAGTARVHADDTAEPYWPGDKEDRLTEVSDQIVDVMREQRVARFDNDQEKLKTLDERMKKLNEEKVQLLHSMGELQ